MCQVVDAKLSAAMLCRGGLGVDGGLPSTPWVVGSFLMPDLCCSLLCLLPDCLGVVGWRWTLTESLILAQDERWRRA